MSTRSPSIEYMLEVIDCLDGAGIIVEDPELIAEELEAMGYTYEGEACAEGAIMALAEQTTPR